MSKRACVLALGGLDPGGGAGIAADLRAIDAAGAFGCPVIALTTVQSTDGIRSATSFASDKVIAMAREVVRAQDVKAFKIGALGNRANVLAVSQFLKRHKDIPAVVDPVMIASRGGTHLLDTTAVTTARKELVPRAFLLTPNVPEAEALTGMKITRMREAKDAAKRLCDMGANAVLIKGGHLSGSNAVDVLVTQKGDVDEFSSERLPIRTRIHGGGCSLASLIAGRLAREYELIEAVTWSKKTLSKALADLANVGGHLRVIVF
jgi:hydroxymethylpyrimidine/phosphomethylpyrimidine kinase